MLLELVRGEAADGRIWAVYIKINTKAVGHFAPRFFQVGEGGAGGQQLGFERTLTRFGLGVVVGIAHAGVAGPGLRLRDAGAAGGGGTGSRSRRKR